MGVMRMRMSLVGEYSMCRTMQSMLFGCGVGYSVGLGLIAFRRYFSGQVSHVTYQVLIKLT